MTLTEINNSFDTDKQTDKGKHGYLDIYEKYFQSVQDSELIFLEIGIWSGNSLRLFEKYFSKAKIIGIDNSQDCINTCVCNTIFRTEVYKVNQSEPKELIEFSRNRLFDIIIDDGSHYSPHQILSFQVLFERLKSEGLYIVEDLHCSYEQKFGFRGEKSVNYFLKLAHYLNFRGKLKFASEYEENKLDLNSYDGRFKFIHFYPGLCIIKKR